MTTTRTPLRITLGGGGSDLEPSRGVCLAATISPSTTITVTEHWEPTYILHYAHTETWEHVDQIQHRIFREVFRALDVKPGIQVASLSDVPGGTGLGNSGAFTVGLIRALRPNWSRPRVANLACQLDIGQQDQWSAVYGGFNVYDFRRGTITPLDTGIGRYLRLYYTDLRHNAAEILTGPTKTRRQAKEEVDAMVSALADEDLDYIGSEFNAQWNYKYRNAPTRAHDTIDEYIQYARAHGAIGAKLVGAGDGGFILCIAGDPDRLTDAMNGIGLRSLPFDLTNEGSRCV